MTLIRPATPADAPAIAAIILPTIRAGETYALDRDMPEAAALAYWLAPEKQTFVAEDSGTLLGTYYLRPNQLGGGRHVCNCGYMTSPAATGRGIASQMCEHSLTTSRAAGFRAMQFNFVVSTNLRAIRLWETPRLRDPGPVAQSIPTSRGWRCRRFGDVSKSLRSMPATDLGRDTQRLQRRTQSWSTERTFSGWRERAGPHTATRQHNGIM